MLTRDSDGFTSRQQFEARRPLDTLVRLHCRKALCNIVLHIAPGARMTLTVRLDPQLEDALARHCRRRRQTKTQVLTQLLREHLAAAGGETRSPWLLARELGVVGSFASGKGDLAENRKRILKEKLRAKHSR